MNNLTKEQVSSILDANKDNSYVPKSYGELYQVYIEPKYSLVRNLVRKGYNRRDIDELNTLPHDVFLRCMDHGILEKFDPNLSNFGGLLFTVARSVIENRRSKRSRDPLGELLAGSLEVSNEDDDTFEKGVYDPDRYCHPTPDSLRQLIIEEDVATLVEFAEQAFERGKTKRDRSLTTLLSMLYNQEEQQDLESVLGVTDSTVTNWKLYLRGALSS